MKRFIIFLLFINFVANAQVKFEASAPKAVALNQQFEYTLTISVAYGELKEPSFDDFSYYGRSQSSGIKIINGTVERTATISYTLMPKKQGTFTIPAAVLTYKGKPYKTKPITIHVGAPKKQTRQQNNRNQGYDPFANDPFFQQIFGNNPFFRNRNKHRPGIQQRQQPKPQTPEEKAVLLKHVKDEIFIATTVSKENPYINEALLVTYKLYVSEVIILDYSVKRFPEFEGFWTQDIKGQYRVQQTDIDGKPYRYITLKQMLFYPQKSGKLKIKPIKVDMLMQVPTNQRDIFGRRQMERKEISKKSTTKTITVKALPEAGKPIDFSGAVGQFDFSAQLSKNKLNAGESTDLYLKIQGLGNLKLLSFPELKLPSELEVYEPEQEERIATTLQGLKGAIQQKYTLVPEYGGKFPIQSLSFTYFDPKQEKYIRKDAQNLVLDVAGEPKQKDDELAANTLDEKNKPISFYKNATSLSVVKSKNTHFFKTKLFWILLLMPFALIPLLLLFKQKRDAYYNDVAGLKSRRASRLVKKYLKEARKNKNNKEAFYEALERAYHNFLKAKLKIETSDFSQDKITELLANRQVSQELITRFITSLKSCDMARYSPFTSADINNEYKNASEIITQLNKML